MVNTKEKIKNTKKQDITKVEINALFILSLRNIMMHDAALSVNRVLLYIETEYNVRLNKAMFQQTINDAKQLVEKVRDKSIEV